MKRKASPSRPVCPYCRHPGFTMSEQIGAKYPLFTCSSCGRGWTNGGDGEPYASAAKANPLNHQEENTNAL